MTSRPVSVSVTQPVGQAIDRVKELLFRPFDLGRWFAIGFCAWLASLGEGGFHGNFNVPSKRSRGSAGRALEEAWDFVLQNLHWILPLVLLLVVIGLALWVLFTWLSSRGKFMFLHCVALNKAEVGVPWRQFAREGNSLCWFRIGLGLIGSLLILPLVVLIVFPIIAMVRREAPNLSGILLAGGSLLLLIAVALLFFVVEKLTKDFVVPIMFLRGKHCLAGWSELRGLLLANVGNFILYFLFQIVLSLAIGTLVVVVILATCCVAGCLMAIPYLGTVLLLPVLVFSRAYSLHYLAQFGKEYDVFSTPPAATLEMPPSAV